MKHIYRQAGGVLAVAMLGSMGAAHAYEWQVNEDTSISLHVSVELGYYVNQEREQFEPQAVDTDNDGILDTVQQVPAGVDGVSEFVDAGSEIGI